MSPSVLIRRGFPVALVALVLSAAAGRPAEPVPTFAQLAKARKAVPGAPKYSDVTVRSLRPHPVPGKPSDPHDTLRMIEEFHVTRLEWTYHLDAAFVRKLKVMGLTAGGAIEDDPGSATKLGRVIGRDSGFVAHRWFPNDRRLFPAHTRDAGRGDLRGRLPEREDPAPAAVGHPGHRCRRTGLGRRFDANEWFDDPRPLRGGLQEESRMLMLWPPGPEGKESARAGADTPRVM